MLFNSPQFLFGFLPIVLIGFYGLLALGFRRALFGWLAFTSVFFYGFAQPMIGGLLVASVAANYGLGRLLSFPLAKGVHRKLILIAGISINLLPLLYFKYTNFIIDTGNAALGTNITIDRIALPIGISFFYISTTRIHCRCLSTSRCDGQFHRPFALHIVLSPINCRTDCSPSRDDAAVS